MRCSMCKGEGILKGTRKSDGSISQCPACKGSGVIPAGHYDKGKGTS